MYKSQAHKDLCHRLLKEGKLEQAQVDKWDKAQGDMKLPDRLTPKKYDPVTLAWIRRNKPQMLK